MPDHHTNSLPSISPRVTDHAIPYHQGDSSSISCSSLPCVQQLHNALVHEGLLGVHCTTVISDFLPLPSPSHTRKAIQAQFSRCLCSSFAYHTISARLLLALAYLDSRCLSDHRTNSILTFQCLSRPFRVLKLPVFSQQGDSSSITSSSLPLIPSIRL